MYTTRMTVGTHRFTPPRGGTPGTQLAIPTVKGTWGLRYGQHAYRFMDFGTARGLELCISHRNVMAPGFKRLAAAAATQGKTVSLARCFSERFHYGFNLLEQMMLMTVPHTVTPLGGARFLVNLWSWYGFFLVDADAGTVTYHLLDDQHGDHVLGSQQWYDAATDELYAMSYSLGDSFARIEDPSHPVAFRIFKHKLGEPGTETVWQGELADYMHDILVNRTRQYSVACELGMYQDARGNMLPSKVLVTDLRRGKEWVLDRFMVAAHACFNPQDASVFYISNHNFEFEHSNLFQLMKKGSYAVKFRGAASIFKYELTPEGPRETGCFTREDFLRLTNMHAFMHRGRPLIAAMGFPDEIFIIDADDMSFIRKITVSDPVTWKHAWSKQPALIGTIAPSPDGEALFVQTTGSFQVVDLHTGEASGRQDHFFSRICFNHMAAWGPGS